MTNKAPEALEVTCQPVDLEKLRRTKLAIDEQEENTLNAIQELEGESPFGELLESVPDPIIRSTLQGHLLALANQDLTRRLESIGTRRSGQQDRLQEGIQRNHLAEQIGRNASRIDPNVLPPNTSVIVLAEHGKPQTADPTLVVEVTQLRKGSATELRAGLFICSLSLLNMPGYYRIPDDHHGWNELAALVGVQHANGGYWHTTSGNSARSGFPCIVREASFSYAEVERAALATSQREKAYPGAKLQASITYQSLLDLGVNPEDARQAAIESAQGI